MSLKSVLNRKNDKIDSLLSEFERDINGMSRKLQSGLTALFRQGDYGADEIRAVFIQAGYQDAVNSFIAKYEQMFDFAKDLAGEIGVPFQLSRRSLEVLELMKGADLKRLGTTSEAIINNLINAGVQNEINKAPFTTIVQNMRDEIDDMKRRLVTEADTGIYRFDRAIKKAQYDESDIETFEYFGPLDDKTREECRIALAANKQGGLTRDEIQELPVDFVNGGGWNCRHEFLPYVE